MSSTEARPRTRGTAFGARLLLVAAAAFLAAGIWRVAVHPRAPDSFQPDLSGSVQEAAESAEPLALLRKGAHLVYLSTRAPGRPRLAFASLADPGHTEVVTRIEAERVHAAGSVVLCLGDYLKVDGMMGSGAFLLDEHLQIQRRFFLDGLPSRARCSADGRSGAATFFVRGDSYAAGGFSTRTYLLDLAGTQPPLDLETFEVRDGGLLVDAPDVNFWGVTFSRTQGYFFASCASGGIVRLIEGSRSDRSARVLGKKVECPSLSPEGRRLAFKHAEPGTPVSWRLAVLELADGDERILDGETRSVDDQAEWLDDHTLLYGLPREEAASAGRDVWRLDVDAERPAERYLRDAFSPSVVRP